MYCFKVSFANHCFMHSNIMQNICPVITNISIPEVLDCNSLGILLFHCWNIMFIEIETIWILSLKVLLVSVACL